MTNYIQQRQDSLEQSLRPIFGQVFTGSQSLVGRDSSQDALSFVISQLAHTENRVFERLYTPMQYELFLPITRDAGEYATEIRYETYDYAGHAHRASRDGSDINFVDVAYGEKTFPVMYGNVGYSYSQEELRQTAFLKRPISERKVLAATDAYRRHMNQVGLMGEEESGLTGLFNNKFVAHGYAPHRNWSDTSTTVDQILQDVNTLIATIWDATSYCDLPSTIIMPPSAYQLIASTPRSSTSDMTILKFLEENNVARTYHGRDLLFFPGYGLENAGFGGTKRMVGYVKSDDRLVMHIPLPLRFLSPQLVGLRFEIPGEYKYSGVEFRYPKSAYYMDGI